MDLEFVFGEERVNAFAPGAQTAPRVASFADGDFVAVWQSRGQDGAGLGIVAQRYDADGNRLGPEFRVNTEVRDDQSQPDVAVLADGRFLVVWRDANAPDGAGAGLVGRLFEADGEAIGEAFVVNASTAGDQGEPRVAALADGGFAVAYTDAGAFPDVVRVGFYDADAAQPPTEITVASSAGAADQGQPALVALADGGVVVAWRDAATGEVSVQTFDDAGAATNGAVPLAPAGGSGVPAVAATPDGGFVVSWSAPDGAGSQDVFAQAFAAPGVAGGAVETVNTTTAGAQTEPAIAVLSSGDWVIAWRSGATDGGEILAQSFAADGTRRGEETSFATAGTQREVALAALPEEGLIALWTTDDSAVDGSSSAVVRQLFGDPANFTAVADPVLSSFTSRLLIDEPTANAGPVVIDAGFSLTDADTSVFAGGQLRLDPAGADAVVPARFGGIDGSAQHQLSFAIGSSGPADSAGDRVLVEGVEVGTLRSDGRDGRGLVVDLGAEATLERVGALIGNLNYANESDDPMAAHSYQLWLFDGDGGSFVQTSTIEIRAEKDSVFSRTGDATPVNTYVIGTQSAPTVSSFADGSTVAAWTSFNQDGSSDGVYARLFDADGAPPGNVFPVNTTTVGAQNNPHVTVLADGSFIVVWDDGGQRDGEGGGIVGRRFARDGSSLSDEFVINDITETDQFGNEVAALAGGGFVVVYDDVSTGRPTAQIRVFDENASPLGPSFGVEPNNSFQRQQVPNVAGLSDGGFVVTWQEFPGPANLFAQIFEADGSSRTDPIRVIAANAGFRAEVSLVPMAVTGLEDGNFVIVWTDNFGDGSATSVFAEILDPLGNRMKSAFLVNETTEGAQGLPAVTALGDGGFVIGWSGAGVGDDNGVFVQEYDAAGNRVDGEQRVHDGVDGNQSNPALAATSDGFTVVYADTLIDGVGTGIAQQRFVNTPPTVSTVQISGFEDADLELDAGLFRGGFADPQGTALAQVIIESLPERGVLLLAGETITTSTVIDVEELLNGALVYRGDLNASGSDAFTWRGSDGGLSSTTIARVELTLAATNDAPTFEAASYGFSVAEDAAVGTVVGTLTASDPDAGDVLSFAPADLFGGAFDLAADGTVTVAGPLDFERVAAYGPAAVTVSDGTLGDEAQLEIAVTDVDEPPAIADQSFTFDENETGLIGVVAAEDPEGAALSWAIVAGNGAGLFSIDAATGELTAAEPLDFETEPGHALTIEVSDGTFTTSATVTILVNDGTETGAPVFDRASYTFAAAENTAPGALLGQFTVSDPDAGDALTFAIVAGNENGLFTLDPVTGELRLAGALDHERAPEVELIVAVTDAGGPEDTAPVTLTVGDVDEAPVLTSPTAVSVLENQELFVVDVTATDPEGANVTYEIVGGADSGIFSLDPTTGELAFVELPDFEAPGDDDGDNVYWLTVAASDGGLVTEQELAVTVLDLSPPQPGVRVSVLEENADFSSTFGWYDKTTGEAGLLFVNSNLAEDFVGTVTGVPSDDLGFFFVPDGAANFAAGGPLAGVDPATLEIAVVDGAAGGSVVATTDGTVLLGRPNARGSLQELAYFSQAGRNLDELDHTSGDDELGLHWEEGAPIGWEDIQRLGDADFDDLIVSVETIPAPDPLALRQLVATSPLTGQDLVASAGKPEALTFLYAHATEVSTAQDADKARILTAAQLDYDGKSFVVVTDEENAVKALAGEGKRYFAGDVAVGETFEARERGDAFGSKTFVHFYDDNGGELLQSVEYHTSGSQPMQFGDVVGNVTLVGYAGAVDAFAAEADKVWTGFDLTAVFGDPVSLSFVYEPGTTLAAAQGDHAKFEEVTPRLDDDNLGFWVVSDKKDPFDDTAKLWFAGEVAVGDAFEAKSAAAGEDKLKGDTYLHLFDTALDWFLGVEESQLQTLKYKTDGAEPIAVDDVLGGATLVDYVGEDGVFLA